MDILFQEYSQQDEKIQGIILKYAIENIEHTIKMACKIDSSLLNALFESNSICLVDKVDVFVAMIPELARIEVRDYLAILGLYEYDKIFEPRLRPKFPIDEVSSKLLMAFQERGWIYTYFQDPGQNGYYRIRRTAVGVGSGKV